MVKETLLYDRLGISTTSNEAEIKKAYKKAALKWHPDKNPNNKEEANTKFQEISQSFDILSDPTKRSNYDKFGMDAINNEGSSGMNPEDIFSQFFGGGNPFGGGSPFGAGGPFGGGGGPFSGGGPFGGGNNQETKENININLEVDLKSIYNEKNVKISYDKKIYCKDCEGTGNKNKISPKCKGCDGQGKTIRVVQMGPMISQQIQACNSCRGTGKATSKKEDNCITCNGKSYNTSKVEIPLPLKNGLNSGNRISLRGQGHDFKNYKTDLLITIKVVEDKMFKRVDEDLITVVNLELFQSLLGFNKLITHMDGKIINISTDTTTKHDSLRRIKGKGMRNLENGKIGDLIIKFKIKYPNIDDYSKEELTILKKLLSKKCKNEITLENEITTNKQFSEKFEKCNLESLSDNQTKFRESNSKPTSNEEDVQGCVQQ